MAETINSLDGSVCAPTAGRGCCACQPFPGEHQLPLEGISLPTPPPFSRCFVFEHWIETGKSWVEAFCTPVMGFEVPGGSPAVPLSSTGTQGKSQGSGLHEVRLQSCSAVLALQHCDHTFSKKQVALVVLLLT